MTTYFAISVLIINEQALVSYIYNSAVVTTNEVTSELTLRVYGGIQSIIC